MKVANATHIYLEQVTTCYMMKQLNKRRNIAFLLWERFKFGCTQTLHILWQKLPSPRHVFRGVDPQQIIFKLKVHQLRGLNSDDWFLLCLEFNHQNSFFSCDRWMSRLRDCLWLTVSGLFNTITVHLPTSSRSPWILVDRPTQLTCIWIILSTGKRYSRAICFSGSPIIKCFWLVQHHHGPFTNLF